MLGAFGFLIYQLSRSLADLEHLIAKDRLEKGGQHRFGPFPLDHPIFAVFDTVEKTDLPFTMPVSYAQIARIKNMTLVGVSLDELYAAFHDLHNRQEDELRSIMFFSINSSRVQYFLGAPLLGPGVSDRFSEAIDDIEGAGKCLALDQGTAAVLHLMRVMEVGLRALARVLGIPYAPSWEGYLQQIQARIATKHKTKKVKWKRDENFFRDVSGDLLTVKQAWRNPTMHVGRKYSADEAEEIFRAVRSFMQRLANGLPK